MEVGKLVAVIGDEVSESKVFAIESNCVGAKMMEFGDGRLENPRIGSPRKTVLVVGVIYVHLI
jgi:hypothetical protein